MSVPPVPQHPAVAFSADAHFSVPLGIAVLSLLESAHPDTIYDVYILDGGVTDRVRRGIEDLKQRFEFRVTWLDVRRELLDLPAGGRFTAATYYRFLLPDLLPNEVKRVLYLDADVLVCDDLTELFAMDLEGCPLAAPVWQLVGRYRDTFEPLMQSFHERLEVPRDGLPYHFAQMLMDLDAMRREGWHRKLVDCARTADPAVLAWADQDVMNKVLRGRMKVMSYRYVAIPLFAEDAEQGEAACVPPFVYSAEELREAYRNPAIVHYAATKPNILKGSLDRYDEMFFAAWRRSPWAGCVPYVPVRMMELGRRHPLLARALMCIPRLFVRCPRILRGYGALLQALAPGSRKD